GTFSTGTGAVSLNGNTSVAGTNTFTVGTGATSLGGTLSVSGIITASTLGANTGAVGICRNSSNQISSCGPNPDSVSLQQAYDTGNTIATTNGHNIDFTLYDESSNSGTATSFTLTNAGTGRAFVINDANL